MRANYPGRRPLVAIADDMLCTVRGGAPKAVVTLTRGLTLTLTLTGSNYTLTCGRKEIFPSLTELTVIATSFGLFQASWEEFTIREWRCYRYSWEWVDLDSLVGKMNMQ